MKPDGTRPTATDRRPGRCLLYYITDRKAFAPDEPTRCRRVLEKISEAARAGVDYIQLRERDLPTRELELLAREAVQAVRDARKLATVPPMTSALVINSRTDIALATGADGVQLRAADVSSKDVREAWRKCSEYASIRESSAREPLIGVSCHSPEEVSKGAADGATFAAFAPVFEKKGAPGTHPAGLPQLREACKMNIPVFALGGVTLENAKQCLEAGAAGIAAIRLFQENDMAGVVRTLRNL